MQYHQSLVLEWLRSGADYDQGAALYAWVGKKQNMSALFPGKKHRLEHKLRYELCKSVGLDWLKVPLETLGDGCAAEKKPLPVSGPVPISVSGSTGSSSATSQDNEPAAVMGDSDHYPSDVRRVIHEYGEAYRERSRLHFKMTSLPEYNQPEIVAQRRDLLLQIKALSLRMDLLHQAKKNYQLHCIIPDPAMLWSKPAVSPGSASQDKQLDNPLPEDPAELRRLKKNLQTYNVKDNNLLLYQSATVQPEKHPMPQGPRRLGIEKRIRVRLKQIERIDYKLVEHAG